MHCLFFRLPVFSFSVFEFATRRDRSLWRFLRPDDPFPKGPQLWLPVLLLVLFAALLLALFAALLEVLAQGPPGKPVSGERRLLKASFQSPLSSSAEIGRESPFQ